MFRDFTQGLTVSHQARWFIFNAPASALPVSDTFTGPNDTELNGRALPVGGVSWVAWQGASSGDGYWFIQSDQAVPRDIAEDQLVVDVGASDGTVSVDIAVPAGDPYTCGLVLRRVDSDNYIRAGITFDGDEADAQIAVVTAGVTTVPAFNFSGVTGGTTVNLKAVLSGNNIQVLIDNVEVIPATAVASFATATKFGIVNDGAVNTCYFDNFAMIA